MNLSEALKTETKEIKTAFINKTKEWARADYDMLKRFALDYEKNYNVNNERKYYGLPNYITSAKGTVDMHIEANARQAEKHYNNSIEKLAFRIEKKNLELNKLELKTTYLDPNIATTITDGKQTISAYTIIASGAVQKPHYRYLIK